MQQSEEQPGSGGRFLPPIDASYQPARAIPKIAAMSSHEDILAALEKDGGVILTDFVSVETMNNINEELEPWATASTNNEGYNNFIGKKTVVTPGLVGKSDTIANIIDTNEIFDQLLQTILLEQYTATFESHTEELVTEPLLSVCSGFSVSRGSPRQALHRDVMNYSGKYGAHVKLNESEGFGCFLAGTKITRENGGTMVIPGSHKWEQDRQGRPDEVSFLEMNPGDAFIYLGSLVHGAGYNTTDEVRKLYLIFFNRGTLRQEENMFLSTPRSKVMKMSPKMLSLLGFKKPAGNWLGLVENGDAASDLKSVYERMLA